MKWKERIDQSPIFKLLMSPGIDSKASIPSAYVAWLTGTKTLCYMVPKNPSSAVMQ